MSSFTPGSWQTHVIKESVSVFGNDGCLVAVMFETHRLRPRDMAIANANLIDAAPEMLDMLKECRATLASVFVHGVPDGLVDRVNTLIQKAEGNDAAK